VRRVMRCSVFTPRAGAAPAARPRPAVAISIWRGRERRRLHVKRAAFYQHFHSKRQLFLTLMDDLLEGRSQLDLRPAAAADVRAGTCLSKPGECSNAKLNQWIDSATHLIYHAMFTDPPRKRRNRT
jgi:hypothetical protein